MTSPKPQKLDTLLAFKAIALSDALSDTDKRVAAQIIDSFNHRTTQCDPSLNRIAHMVGVSRRTVIRAIKRIEHHRFIRKRRHGGYFHRNSYEPNWPLYRDIENAWATRKKTKHWKSAATDMSPCQSQSCHPDGDLAGTQTLLINQTNKPIARRAIRDEGVQAPDSSGQTEEAEKRGVVMRERSRHLGGTTSSREAAAAAAERRWSGDLHDKFSWSEEIYARLIGGIDESIQAGATAAEIIKRGAGIAYILEHLPLEAIGNPKQDAPLDGKQLESDRRCAPRRT